MTDYRQTVNLLSINFLHKLRDEQKFATLEKLVQQIHADIDAARNWWADA